MELQIFEKIEQGKNVLLHGPGGTGKSYSIRKLISLLKKKNKKFACTASTGIAALNLSENDEGIKAKTLHSWAGVGLASGNAQQLVGRIRSRPEAVNRWKNTDILIIDEIGMIGEEFFCKLEEIALLMRGITRGCFGGMIVVASGDFYQLPPVKDGWIFKSRLWSAMNFSPIIFKEPKRYPNVDFYNLLMRVRCGETTDDDFKKLKARCRAYKKLNNMLEVESKKENTILIKPTVLYSTKKDVHSYNVSELEKLKGVGKTYTCKDKFHGGKLTRQTYMTMLDNSIDPTITLRVGAQVMLKYNLEPESGLVNGSRGVIVEMYSDSVKVAFVNGTTTTVFMNAWNIEENMKPVATRTQLPFILAWACTIHKSQGSTIDYCVCNIGSDIFAPGQAYVALSRNRTLQGLFISSFLKSSIRADPDVKKYVKSIEQ